MGRGAHALRRRDVPGAAEGARTLGDNSPSPVAAIDIGSNTVHLLVARPRRDRADLKALADAAELVRFGADIAVHGEIGRERMKRARNAVREQVALARSLGATTVLGIATEGVRAARNGADVLDWLARETGVRFALVSGEQEAALTYWGVTSGLPATYERHAVVDLGGGSMEIAVGEGEHVRWRASLPLGAGTVHARWLSADPPASRDISAAHVAIGELLRPLDPPLPVHEVAVCGGAATGLRALTRRAPEIQHLSRAFARARAARGLAGRGNPARRFRYLTHEHLSALLHVLQTLPAAEVAARYGIDAGRAPLLPAGCLALLTTLEKLHAPRLRVSRQGIREGMVYAYHRYGDAWLDAAARG